MTLMYATLAAATVPTRKTLSVETRHPLDGRQITLTGGAPVASLSKGTSSKAFAGTLVTFDAPMKRGLAEASASRTCNSEKYTVFPRIVEREVAVARTVHWAPMNSAAISPSRSTVRYSRRDPQESLRRFWGHQGLEDDLQRWHHHPGGFLPHNRCDHQRRARSRSWDPQADTTHPREFR